jgi:hypothetical protein
MEAAQMATFLLLLKGGDFSGYSPEEHQKILQDYMGWSQKLRTQDKYKGGEELKGNGRVLAAKDGRIVDGPFTETKEVIGGYFLIEEPNLEAATATAKDCPHLKYKGSIELREVNPH